VSSKKNSQTARLIKLKNYADMIVEICEQNQKRAIGGIND
jgi:hypothetical protein